MELQFSITILLRSFMQLQKAIISLPFFCFCGLRADCLELKMTSDRDFSI